MVGAATRGPLFGGPHIFRFFNSNATLTAGDLVNVTDSKLELAAAGERIAGVISKAATNASTNHKVNITPYLTFLMDNDNVGTTFAATHANSYFFDITGTTGAQVVDTSTAAASDTVASTGQLKCLAFNPNAGTSLSDTSVGLYMVNRAEAQF
jgi:hypothetical protein